MKHLDRLDHPPRGLRRLLRPGPRPWFHRPRPAAPDAHLGADIGADIGPGAAERVTHGADFDRLVALYRRMMELRDRALVETRVGEDALSVGDELKATQHFSFGSHYRRRADELEAAIHHRLEAWQQTHGGCRLAAEALRAARERLYGSPEVENRPEFV
jgi:hypothetical protein